METSLKYKLMIKGKEARVGDVLWQENNNRPHSKVKIVSVKFIDRTGTVSFEPINNEYSSTIYGVDINDEAEFINKYFFWEKPIIYQLPDTEGNLSEVKVGQKVYLQEIKSNKAFIGSIIETTANHICIKWDNDTIVSWVKNESCITNSETYKITTNRPKRDFSPYIDWNQAPNGYDYGAVDESGYAFWYSQKPFVRKDCSCWDCDNNEKDAGFRQNLINPETGYVDDWKDSLVERPKEKVNNER